MVPPGAGVLSHVHESSAQADHHLSRELHDQVGQALNLVLLEMERLKVDQVDRPGVQDELERLQAQVRTALSNLREVLFSLRDDAKSITNIRQELMTLGYRLHAATGVIVSVSVAPDWPDNLRPGAALHLIRIVEEATSNAIRHAHPTSIEVELDAGSERLTVTIRDDGRGMAGGISIPGLGTRGMLERAHLLGGDLSIQSELGRGTAIVAVVPAAALLKGPRARIQPGHEGLKVGA